MTRQILILVVCLCCGSAAYGQASPTQITPSNDTGLKAYETYSGSHENVNLSNGNLSLEIPVFSLPGRNGLNFDLAVQYNSKIWSPHATYSASGADLTYRWQHEYSGEDVGQLGWTLNIPSIFRGNAIYDSYGSLLGYTPYIITLPSGGKTSVAWADNHFQPTIVDSSDGSSVSYLNSIQIAYLKDGTQIHFPCEYGCHADTITDTNNNTISISDNQITDTLGRTVTTTPGPGPNQTTYSYKDSNGATQNIVFTLSPVPLFQNSGPRPFANPTGNSSLPAHTYVWVFQPGSGSYMLLTRIDLPGGLAYTFSYNDYGELIQITYPTGGYTKYTYAAFQHGETFWFTEGVAGGMQSAGLNVASDFRELTSKRVCRNTTGVCSPSEEDVTTYTPAVADPNLNNSSVEVRHFLNEASNIYEKSIYEFTNTDIYDNQAQYYTPRETKRSIYDSNGTLLRTVETNYVNDPDTGRKFLPNSVVTTLYDVTPPLVKRVDTTYDTYTAIVDYPPPPEDNPAPGVTARTRFIDNPLSETEYDYGPNAAGAPLRTVISAWWKGRWADHLWNRPLTQEVQDGAGNRLSYEQREYDNYTEGIAVSGATQRGVCNPGGCANRGNLTAVSHWRKSDGAMLTSRNQFDDAGNVIKTTDPLGHFTTFSFSDNWTGGDASCAPSAGTAAAYPTLVTNQLGHQLVTTYNSCTGTVATRKDANQQTTTTTYDALQRPLTVALSDGGFTQYTYNSPTETQVQKKPAASVTDSSLWPTAIAFFDGLGRTSQTAVKNGESGSGWDVQTTCYDSRGFATFNSYPAQVSSVPITSPCSLPGETLQVDALGRVTEATHSDGSAVLTDYAGRATRVRDEGRDNSGDRVTQVSQMDGLGRLVSVCEKSSATQMGSNNAPSACGQDIPETGFMTTYQYDINDPVGSAWQINQPGLATRFFVNDSLGQLVKATNPEAGTTQYVYNDDGTLAQRIRPKPNQSNPNTLLTTSYVYDAIRRLTQTTYDDGVTPAVNRLYDQALSTTGQIISNPIGRLTTVNAVGGQSVDVYSYDPLGRVKSEWQCTPALNCNSQMKQLAYNYDLLGNVTSASNGFGATIGYNYNIASRLTSVTSSLVDSNHPATLASGAVYGPFGLTALSLGNGVAETRGYTPRGLLNSISDNVTLTQPAVPGSGSVTISGSERTIGGPPATTASGSVTLSGTEQSTQVVNQPAAGGSGTVNITGTEQSTQAQSSPGTPSSGSATISGSTQRGYDDGCTCYVYDSGTISITVNGYTSSTRYQQGTTANQIAVGLSNLSNAGVNATVSGGTISLTSASNGANTNYSVSMSETPDRPDLFGPTGAYGGAYSFSLSWTDMSGGTDPTYYTLFDAGTVTVTVKDFSRSVNYNQNSTPATVAADLVTAFSVNASPVNASSSAGSLSLTSKATGAGTNYSLSASSNTNDSGHFAHPSFGANPASATLLGGHDATYNTLFDTGTVSITVSTSPTTQFTKSTPYDQNSTLAGMATALASALKNDPSSPVDATPSGATVSLTSRKTGLAANYPLSTASATNQGTHFSHPSYSGTASGPTLTGGKDAGANINDTGTVSITVSISPTNQFTKSIPYDQASTPSSLASALATAVNGGGSPPVLANASGGQITLVATATGATTNYPLSISSATTSSSFTGTSFPVSASGPALTGGADSHQTPTTPYNVALTFMPNGSIATANDNVNGNWSYGYDDFDRLGASTCNNHCPNGQSLQTFQYQYDRYGNRWGQSAPQGGPAPQYVFDANNRILGGGVVYDAAGNVINDGVGHSFTYDAENRIVSVNGGQAQYVYDGDGNRVRKIVNGVAVDYVYDLSDNAIVEFNSSGAWNRAEVFAGGHHLATYAGGTAGNAYFIHADGLATERARTWATGPVCETISNLPFGDAQTLNFFNGCTTDVSPLHFTGKQSDTETGLDDFPARYYSPTFGRWMSPDWSANAVAVPYASFGNPQSLNLYSYVKNNPTTVGDPDGHCGPCIIIIPAAIVTVAIVWHMSQTPEGQAAIHGAMHGIQQLSSEIASGIRSLPHPSTTIPTGAPPLMPPPVETGTPGSTATAVQTGTPGLTGTAVQTGVPASTSQAGMVNNNAKARIQGFALPRVYSDAQGFLTNGSYRLDAAAMAAHQTGSLVAGKSQFLHNLNASQLVLDAAAVADQQGLWKMTNGSKAKVVFNQPIGVTGAGTLTNVLNLYRTKTGMVHGSPGSPQPL
jgi:RHS repeat-associated protein